MIKTPVTDVNRMGDTLLQYSLIFSPSQLSDYNLTLLTMERGSLSTTLTFKLFYLILTEAIAGINCL